MSDPPDPPDPPDPSGDPRIQIPEILRQPGPQRPPPPAPGAMKSAAEMGKAWSVALEFVFTIVGCALLGMGFDRWQGSAPTGILVGLTAGFVLALVRIIRYTLKQDAAEKRDRESRRKNGQP